MMNPSSTHQLRLPTQARPIDRAGLQAAAADGTGVEPAFLGNLLGSLFGGSQPLPIPLPLPPLPFPLPFPLPPISLPF